MKQVVQNIRDGKLTIAELPVPAVRAGQVLIANACSVISAGTEKMVMELSKKSLFEKARERPDHVRRVLQKIRNEGFFNTVKQVFEKLDEPLAMGYSSAGTVIACGAGVHEYKIGDRVASNGPHAGVVSVPKHLCAAVPENVSFDRAAFAVLGAIALQGVRLAEVSLGCSALVIGLGLVGQITVALLKAQGCRVFGTDPDAEKCKLAISMGAKEASPKLTAAEIQVRSRGLGVDAVIITASTKSNAPIELAGEAVRAKGRVVAVGVVGMNMPRRPFYFKEAEFVVSCSYGPGRYDPEYEDRGRDYPAAHVRWTEQRNIQTILDLMGSGRLDLAPLITHRFPIDEGENAYRLIESGSEPYLAIALEYPEFDPANSPRRIELGSTKSLGSIGTACIGSGNFARLVLLPAAKKSSQLNLRLLCSSGALGAKHAADRAGFAAVTTDEDEVFRDPKIDAVFLVTRHDQHASQVLKAIRASKHVFVEKPLALTLEEIEEIEQAYLSQNGKLHLLVGFNRRFSPAARDVKKFFEPVRVPLTVSIRFNAGEIPSDYWTQDEETGGGRIIGEACHAIDLATFLTGSPPVRVFAESIGGPAAPSITDDQCFITLRHENGSISNIGYLAGGDKAFPKERVEVLGGGRLAVIDDFRETTTSVGGRRSSTKTRTQDKGHAAEIEQFARVLAEGGPSPIPWRDIKTVSLAAILAVRSLREGFPLEIPQ